MTQTYQVLIGKRVILSFRANFAQAADQIRVISEDGSEYGTPLQVADARHRPIEAAKIVNRWCASEGGEAWTPGRTTGLTLRTIHAR